MYGNFGRRPTKLASRPRRSRQKFPEEKLKLHPQGPWITRVRHHYACGSANCSSRGAAHRRRDLAEKFPLL